MADHGAATGWKSIRSNTHHNHYTAELEHTFDVGCCIVFIADMVL